MDIQACVDRTQRSIEAVVEQASRISDPALKEEHILWCRDNYEERCLKEIAKHGNISTYVFTNVYYALKDPMTQLKYATFFYWTFDTLYDMNELHKWQDYYTKYMSKPVSEPKNNDGRSTCFWCAKDTVSVAGISKYYNVCTRCGK